MNEAHRNAPQEANSWAEILTGRYGIYTFILNLGMLAAMGRSQEFAGHFKGAMRNGLSLEDLNEVLLQISLYCGFPTGVDSFRIAKQVLDDQKSK